MTLNPPWKRLPKKHTTEAGVIEYLFVQDENHDQNTILSYEKWKSAETETKHWQTPHLKKAIATLNDILDGNSIIYIAVTQSFNLLEKSA